MHLVFDFASEIAHENVDFDWFTPDQVIGPCRLLMSVCVALMASSPIFCLFTGVIPGSEGGWLVREALFPSPFFRCFIGGGGGLS